MKIANLIVIILALFAADAKAAEPTFITLVSTTSTRDSGLFDAILPIFTKQSGIAVRVIAVGTGQAIRLAASGDADVLLVHHRKSENDFVAKGYGVKRFDVMYNDFIIIGPKADPATISETDNVVTAFKLIAASGQVFLSRGDDSGTNKKERAIWRQSAIDVTAASGSWYRETGSGMGATLNTASAINGYTLSDRGTWLAFKNKGDLKVLVQGDKRLLNPYGVILVNPERYRHVKAAAGQAFIDWLLSPQGQNAIDDFRIDGKQLFKANAK